MFRLQRRAPAGRSGTILGYHSSRRLPDLAAVAAIEGIYRELMEKEDAPDSRKAEQPQGRNGVARRASRRGPEEQSGS